MPLRNTLDDYGSLSKFFHWFIALLIIFMLILGTSFDFIPKGQTKSLLMQVHKATGLTILALMILRLLWRWINPLPQLPTTTPTWQKLSSRSLHRLLYLILIIMPLTGWMMSTAAGRATNFWWLFKVNVPFIAKSKPLAQGFSTAHEIIAWTIVCLLGLHILAALKHQIIDKDNVLKRMWR